MNLVSSFGWHFSCRRSSHYTGYCFVGWAIVAVPVMDAILYWHQHLLLFYQKGLLVSSHALTLHQNTSHAARRKSRGYFCSLLLDAGVIVQTFLSPWVLSSIGYKAVVIMQRIVNDVLPPYRLTFTIVAEELIAIANCRGSSSIHVLISFARPNLCRLPTDPSTA